MTILAALVKYNPCSVYARRGVPCPVFSQSKARKCLNHPDLCINPSNFDGWLKDAIQGKIKFFFPERISLLEMPDAILLLYHSEKRAIVGEAKIIRATQEGRTHKYWFEHFILYPNPVKLQLLKTDPRMIKLAKRGRWRLAYISQITVDEIRELAELQGESKERLRRELELLRLEAEKRSAHVLRIKRSISELENQFLLSKGIGQEILQKANDIYRELEKRNLIDGRPRKLVFYASVYLTYRLLSKPKRLKELAKIGQLDSRKLWRAVRLIRTSLGLKLPLISPIEWVIELSRNQGIPQKIIDYAIDMSDKLRSVKSLRTKSPISIAATAIYLSNLKHNEPLSQIAIATITGVSGVTLRNLTSIYFNNKMNEKTPKEHTYQHRVASKKIAKNILAE